jgi:transcription-repair coupling factor (superfamily II helicase)
MPQPSSKSQIAEHDVPLRSIIELIAFLPQVENALRDWETDGNVSWEGAWLGGLAPLVAALVHRERAPCLLLTSQPTDVETLSRDLDQTLGYRADTFPIGMDDAELDSLTQQESLMRLQVCSRLQLVGQDQPPVVVTTLPALMQSVPSPQQLLHERRSLKLGDQIPISQLRGWLAANGYLTTTSVQLAGEYTVRGGLMDVFPPDMSTPVRIEWFDNEIESLRTFDVVSQRSMERLQHVELLAAGGARQEDGSLLDYLPANTMILAHETPAILHQANAFLERIPFPDRFEKPSELLGKLMTRRFATAMQISDAGYAGSLHRFPLGDVQRIGGDLESIVGDVDQATQPNRNCLMVCVNDGEVERVDELTQASQTRLEGRLSFWVGTLASGFEIPGGPLVLTVSQLLRRSQIRRGSRKMPSRAIDSFLDLREGDLVVHLAHGIGVYRGLEMIEKSGQKHEHLEIEFAEGTKVYVPTSKIDLVQRYVGGTRSTPKLAKIGSQAWVRQKQAAKQAVTDMASDLLELQAQRGSQRGIAFGGETTWQSQFDASFPYDETADQTTAIAAVKKDMTEPKCMDRLICGDVGFGKTEVAMRAAFKAVDSGYQVAILVPTTVLAEQHYKSFRERMAEFPLDIAKLSRFCSKAEQKKIVERLRSGNIDIVIGTHRLASKDVAFHNLGLVVIDEEQRFGVAVKERLKKSMAKVDVLTLSATPIPRTLHMSLLGVRDISNLETAPEERLSVETRVIRFDETTIRNAILRELNRGGQIYFVHNRIGDIDALAARLQRLVPEARLVIGHGQMPERKLEKVMVDFIDHKFDLLLSTTIIESGLDIPNANTMFIDGADHYGLAELHQLRGRVGRYKHQAYCYMLVDKHKHLSPDSARRLHAIEEYSEIGAGFGIAMRDLEIRGAGNLLGTQQSGHIAAVGYELYCQLLESAVRQLRQQPPKLSIDVEINLPVKAYIDATYIQEMRHKIDLYRRISRIDSIDQISDVRHEMTDRFGKIPSPTENLLRIAELRIDATLWLIQSISVEDNRLVMRYADRNRMEQLAKFHKGLRIANRQAAYHALPDSDFDAIALVQSLLQISI